ncbi:OmpH family outer membrane protein [Edaphocola aurantiacus]|uniref:OmpH family outer membrane protein n=1 Tax=Edaphocola aurantiacus TaxID=2601682 RepID=UPI001C94356B|nr:OmpH family outer membrane protein [Edaphocola aurantiacus]
MNKIKWSLGTVAIACSVLFAACNRDQKKADAAPKANTEQAAGNNAGLKLAYVNGDTLNANYIFLKEQKAAYEKKQNAFENEMQQKEKALQAEAMAFQKKIQAGTMSQAEGEATQKRLGQQQQVLEQRHQTITAQLMKEQTEIQDEFQKRLDAFLEKFNKEKKYDFIFTYSKAGGQILYANKALDITKEVLDAMNAESGSIPAESASNNPLLKAGADAQK